MRTPGALGCLAIVALALAGCGTDVAQTAVYVGSGEPPAPTLDCTLPATPTDLPTDPKLGANMQVKPWALTTGDYRSGQGPGITVAALDSFRLFANGHLLAESTDALVPTFVPLTLLPGQNGVAVAVTAVGRAPAVVVELDELERIYGSDASWQVSSAPQSGYGDAVYGNYDSTWAPAVDWGSIDRNPGCDPGFPAAPGVHLITATEPGTAVFRLDLPIEPIGFAAGTTGGADTEPVVVTTVDDLAKALDNDDPKVVLVPEATLDATKLGDDVREVMACPTACPAGADIAGTTNVLTSNGTCDIPTVTVERSERRLSVGSNTTLVGVGRGATLKGGSLDVGESKNVIVRNLAVVDVNPSLIEAGDGVSIDGADGVWLDHLTFHLISDGFIDCTSGSKNLTFSWIRNEGDNPAACYSRHPRSNEFIETTVTIHHSLWEHVYGRAPLATHSTSRMHLFNNVVSDDPDYAVGSACGAQVLLEASSFENVRYPTAKFDCGGDPTDLGFIRAAGGDNRYGTGTWSHQSAHLDSAEPNDSVVFSPSMIYAYTVDDVSKARTLVPVWAGAGSRWAQPLPP